MSRKLGLVCALVLCCSILGAAAAGAQSLEERLSLLLEDSARGYAAPVVDAFGANLNSGINHQAKTHGFLGFDVGLRVMMVPVPNDARTFTAQAPDVPGGGWEQDGVPITEFTTATAVGAKDGGALIVGTGAIAGDSIYYPDGLDLDLIPMVIPQANIGLLMDTDLMIRYLPSIEVNEDVGKVSFLGIGVRHKVSRYVPLFPIDVSVYAMYQSLDIGDALEASASSFGVVASKSVPLLTVYGGIAKESSSMKIKYDVAPDVPYDVTVVDFEMDGEVSGRITAGFRVTILPILFVSGEASKTFGSDNAGSALGVGIGFNLR